MSKKYFELVDDMSSPERWLLGRALDAQGNKVEARLFLNAEPTHFDGRLRVPISHPGTPLDFSLADPDGFPVVTAKVASALAEWAPDDVQLYPAEVESRPEPYFLVNAPRVVKCIDDEKCEEVLYWLPEDERPEDVGQYRAVYGMRIDPSLVGEAKVFRPWGYTVALLVSEDVKEALERTGATGLDFREVTGPSPISDEERAYKRKCRELLHPPPAARNVAWRSLGSLDELASTPSAICYTWPAYRQNWCVIHREAGRTLLVSDGLSDPFIARMEPSVGFGLELALEVDQPLEPREDLEKSWPLMLLERVAKKVVAQELVRERAKAGLCSLEVPGKGLPRSLVTQEGRVGVLLGLESRTLPRHFSTPFGEVRLVTVKALRPTEWTHLRERGGEGHAELARRFVESGEEHLSRA
jgi:hypothetical protein